MLFRFEKSGLVVDGEKQIIPTGIHNRILQPNRTRHPVRAAAIYRCGADTGIALVFAPDRLSAGLG